MIKPAVEPSIFPEMFETARLRLRSPAIDDAKIIFDAYAQDPDVTRYLVWLPHRSIEATEHFISYCAERWTAKTAFSYVIAKLGDGELLGMIEIQLNQHGANIGYVLAKRHWRQGFMAEAAGCLVKHALRQPAIFRLSATWKTSPQLVRWRKSACPARGFCAVTSYIHPCRTNRAIVICTRSRDSLVYS